jgi:hypothetical protein
MLPRIPHPAPALFSSQLTNFDKTVQFTRFSQTVYPCGICLTSIKGSRCIRLQPCQHVFCKSCLTEFWQLLITEGDVGRVGCPDPKCVKEGILAEEEDVRRVVRTEEDVRRWKWLKEKKEIERGKFTCFSFCLLLLIKCRPDNYSLSPGVLPKACAETDCRRGNWLGKIKELYGLWI